MKVIVGLGNKPRLTHLGPQGSKWRYFLMRPLFRFTRHNVGMNAVAQFARKNKFVQSESHDSFVVSRSKIFSDVAVVEPRRLMNTSGDPIAQALNHLCVAPRDLILVYDEIMLPFAKIRLSAKGVSAGHRGVESVIQTLGTEDFSRLRLGIDMPKKGTAIKTYVLLPFEYRDRKKVSGLLNAACGALESILQDGFVKAQVRWNS